MASTAAWPQITPFNHLVLLETLEAQPLRFEGINKLDSCQAAELFISVKQFIAQSYL